MSLFAALCFSVDYLHRHFLSISSSLILVACCTVPIAAQTPVATAQAGELDLYVQNLRFETLENKLPSLKAGAEKDYFSGVLANRAGQLEESVRLLQKALPALRQKHPARAAIALESLADSFTKLYRYADAAKAYSELLVNYSAQLEKSKLDGIKDDYSVAQLLTASPAQTLSMSAPFRIPTKASPIGTIDAELTVNDVKAPWILDTGANFSVVSASFAKRIGVQPSQDTGSVRGVTGAKSAAHVGVLPELKLGTATVRNVVLLILEDESLLLKLGPDKSYQINAILGYPVFQILGSATFEHSGWFQAGGERDNTAASSRLFMNNLNPLIECMVEGRALLYMFDTGAGSSMFSQRYVQEFPNQFQGLERVKHTFGGAGGIKTSEFYELPSVSLTIAGRDVKLKKVRVLPSAVGSNLDETYGNLGRDILLGTDSFTLDFARMRFSLGNKASGSPTAGNN